MKRGLAYLLCAGVFALATACAADGESKGDNTPSIGETGGMCGGIAGFQCAEEGDYCAFTPGECREIADAAGVCKPKPEICTMDYNPVCGCDGRTYSNACAAASAGVSVGHAGECEKRAR